MIDLDCLDGINIINDLSATAETLTSDNLLSRTNLQSKTTTATVETNNVSRSESNQASTNLLTCMLITANVGTIFEESTLLELWFQQLKSYLTKVRPQLVAIHCQEVGGKNYESSMKHVSDFTGKIIGDELIVNDYTRIRIFLDENFESLEKFTALGSLYLIHKSVENVKLYNFNTAHYETIEGIKVYDGNSINKNTEHAEKVKFPQELFPECRWSRKGFMRTRWLFDDKQPIDLVNIHLFHDASNIVAMKTTPSPYAQNRQQALEFTLNKISSPLRDSWKVLKQSHHHHHQLEQDNHISAHDVEVPLFIFGDFNFRLDTNKVVQRITDGIKPTIKRSADSDEVLEFVYRKPSANKDDYESSDIDRHHPNNNGNDDCVVMTVGKKLFDCENLDETFRATKNTEWLQKLDNELDSFKSKLFEFKISFSPSYPFKEDTTGGHSYMKTRCPAWCDRILFNAAGGNLIYSKNLEQSLNDDERASLIIDSEKRIKSIQSKGDVLYRLMGNSVPMGDHKPVLLYCQLNLSSYRCINNNYNKMSLNNEEETNRGGSNSGWVESTAM